MMIRMEDLEGLSVAELKQWVKQHRRVRRQAVEKEAVYGFVERVLAAQHYRRLTKAEKGVVRQFLGKVTGLSRAQLTRLVQRWMENGCVQKKATHRPTFSRYYTREDVG